MQSTDLIDAPGDDPNAWKLVSGEPADEQTVKDLVFAWRAIRCVKSNAILIAHDQATVGIGMGQVLSLIHILERMVARILGLNTLPKPADAADALAIAICHALRPAGALQGGEREQHLTDAQRQWALASQKAARQRGVRRGM